MERNAQKCTPSLVLELKNWRPFDNFYCFPKDAFVTHLLHNNRADEVGQKNTHTEHTSLKPQKSSKKNTILNFYQSYCTYYRDIRTKKFDINNKFVML